MNLRLVCLLLALSGPVHADDEAERAQIQQKRDAVEAEYTKRQETCRKQFIVTPCLDKARADRQESLKALRAREADLDDERRRQRAEEQSRRMAEKAEKAQAAEPEKSPKPAKEPHAPARKAPRSAAPKPSAAERSAEEQRKREAYEARQREIQEHKQEVEKRNAERASRKPPTPLPVPASSP